ncbi:MAG: hypothetical protein EBE86_028275 [Hormoscilla sp. GUM202]|nr:hypothetical protein [Hormoscilla sp. GUM202]MBO1351015.1 hypothetical protein [Hormoscilla sp. GUM202]
MAVPGAIARQGRCDRAVENVGARHPQMSGKNTKCNYRRAPATGAQTRSPAHRRCIAEKMRSGCGAGARQ